MDWTRLDWTILDRLRTGFLSGSAAEGPYWKSGDDLAAYNATYAERIGWKWDAVLSELKRRGWLPPAGPVLDWGCGSGVAGRRVLEAFGPSSFERLYVWDHSPIARQFARDQAKSQFVGLPVEEWDQSTAPGILLLSHVLTELSPTLLEDLLQVVQRAQAVLWVEPGTHAVGRQIGAIRDRLLNGFKVVAPCTHRRRCPQFDPGRERDWCHFFARPPASIYADPNWVRFGQRAGIDLRSLPYSYLVLERNADAEKPRDLPEGAGRILGRTDTNKVGVRWLECNSRGLEDVTIPKRTNSALVKKLEKRPGLPLVETEWLEGKPVDARELFP